MTDQERAAGFNSHRHVFGPCSCGHCARLADEFVAVRQEERAAAFEAARVAASGHTLAVTLQAEIERRNGHKARLAELAALKPNWDSYGGRPITVAAIKTAELLCEEPPQMTPCSDGGLQLEWHDRGIDFEFRIAPDGTEDDSDYAALQADRDVLLAVIGEQMKDEQRLRTENHNWRCRANYEPCPNCSATEGIGLVSQDSSPALWCCHCNHTGPTAKSIDPSAEGSAADLVAIQGWNSEFRQSQRALRSAAATAERLRGELAAANEEMALLCDAAQAVITTLDRANQYEHIRERLKRAARAAALEPTA